MAVTTDLVVPTEHTTDAVFRAWGLQCRALFVAAGWLQTADTDQIDFATVARSTVANTYAGYDVFRFQDALQATAPIYLKLEYGSGSVATRTAWRVTLGTGSNGAGTITGAFFSLVQMAVSVTDGAGTVAPGYGVSGTGHAAVATGYSTTLTTRLCMLTVERFRDSAGAPTAAGWVITTMGGNPASVVVTEQVYDVTNASARTLRGTGISAMFPTGITASLGGNVGVFAQAIISGTPRYPAIALMGVFYGDIATGATIVADRYGVSRTYKHIFGGGGLSATSPLLIAAASLLMIFD